MKTYKRPLVSHLSQVITFLLHSEEESSFSLEYISGLCAALHPNLPCFSIPVNAHFYRCRPPPVKKQAPTLNRTNTPTTLTATSQSYFKAPLTGLISSAVLTQRMGSIDDPLHSLLIRPERKRGGKCGRQKERRGKKSRRSLGEGRGVAR